MLPPEGNAEPDDETTIYDVEVTQVPRPALPGEVIVLPTADEIIDRLAAELVLHAENCVREFGDFHLALSGGASFERLYRRLMYDPNYRWLPWRRTHLWFVQERCAGFEDEQSSFRLVGEIIGDHADIPPEQVHPIFAESETAEADYERQLRETLAWREKGQDRLDYALLTLEADGRTDGLIPAAPGPADTHQLVRRCSGLEPGGPEWVSLTTPFINAARFIAVLITGADRAEIVDRLVNGDDSADDLPIKGIAPMNGELRWYLDGPACGRLV